MTFTDWWFTWPCLVFCIVFVAAARIAHDHLIHRPRRRRAQQLDAVVPDNRQWPEAPWGSGPE